MQQFIRDLAAMTQLQQFSPFRRQGFPAQSATCDQFLPSVAPTQHVRLLIGQVRDSIFIFDPQRIDG